jgi:DtxR family Mn-dependent transcriptional regulator
MPEHDHPSESVENFLKAVYVLQAGGERVSTNTLSERLGVSAPSVTDMAQRLVSAGLVDYQKYRGVMLTVSGERIALHVLRRHRLIELFLVRELGYALTSVHQEAEALEHAVSEHFIEALAAKLGDPHYDPHGDPIPAADGTMQQRDLIPLTALPVGGRAIVCRLNTFSAEMLQHVLDRGFIVEAQVVLLARDPFEGPLTLTVNGEMTIIGSQAAAHILVQAAPAESASP